MFVEFKNIDDANAALATIHNHPFDARHTFKANRLADIERYSSMDETYTEPELGEYTPKVTIAHLILPNRGLIILFRSGASTSLACRSARTRSIRDIPWR